MLIFDIETNGLLRPSGQLPAMDKIHCIAIHDTTDGTTTVYDPAGPPITAGLKRLAQADAICGHNIINFDIPAIKSVRPEFKPTGQIIDTLVWARLVFGDIKEGDFALMQSGVLPGKLLGSHSLKAYGYRLGKFKGTFGETTDWSEWTPEMSAYCAQDVAVTMALLKKLMEQKTTKEALDLEHQVATIISRQEHFGVGFNIPAAEALYAKLIGERETVEKEIKQTFPPFWIAGKEFTPKRDNAKSGYVAGAAMTKVAFVDFNPGSNQHIYIHLIKRYKWKPTEFVKKGLAPDWVAKWTGHPNEPKIDDEILGSLPYPSAKPLARYKLLTKRIGQIAEGKQSWLGHYNSQTRRIHGAVNSCGAVTGRMTHFNPNLGQVPNSQAEYGPECRALFGVFDEFFNRVTGRFIGCDADGLEARCLAHFLAPYDGGEYARAVLEGKKEDKTDVHSLNAARLVCIRDTAKTFLYAFIYGAGDAKLASILGDGSSGKEVRARFMKGFPALEKLLAAVKKAVRNNGHLKGLDGRIVRCRSLHSALNTLLQGAGAGVMKKALCIMDEKFQSDGLVPGIDYEFVLNVHDEVQIENITDKAPSTYYGEEAAAAIFKAGEHFKFRCPLAGSYAIGATWAETH